ncbi:putative quinol monooxygenase [Nonomuraea sp. NPDC050536]|uniref:putative quinol monooxygenase n=1 Tax=Nonomuraea sp. NPDC050536 TaxID=3364366 RepID=UPI0037CAEAFD
MEILVAVIAFAGAILAAIAAGVLIRRLRDEPEGWLIAWSAAAASLCLSLAAIAIGYLMGFGPATFKVFQVAGSLLAPLWLGVGLIQLLANRTPPKFLGWLFGLAVTVVSGVIMVVDPLIKSDGWAKSLPSSSVYWGIIPKNLLIGVHVIAVLIMLAAVVIAAVRWRSGDELDTDNLHATLVIAPSGIALVGAMRFAVPGIFTTALLVVAAAAVWYAVLRPLAPYEDDEEDDIEQPQHAPAGRRARQEPVPAAHHEMAPPPVEPRRPPSPGLGDLVAEYRAGDQNVDYAARMAPPVPETGPATGYVMNGRHGTGPQDFPPAPATGAIYPGAELFTPAQQPPPPPQPQPQQQAGTSRPSPSIFGLLTVFTLIDGSGEAFDRLADQTVEAVRRGEPDTLVYACHAVKSAPLQRIVYELYRDEVAYHDHQRQPHVERFVNERQAMVLATNIIELNVNAAKVVPLPTVMF